MTPSEVALADVSGILRGSGARTLLTSRFDCTTAPEDGWAAPRISCAREGDELWSSFAVV